MYTRFFLNIKLIIKYSKPSYKNMVNKTRYFIKGVTYVAKLLKLLNINEKINTDLMYLYTNASDT